MMWTLNTSRSIRDIQIKDRQSSICARWLKRFLGRSLCLYQPGQKAERRNQNSRQAENGPAAERADTKRAAEVSAALNAKAPARPAAGAGEDRLVWSENAPRGPVPKNQASTHQNILSNNRRAFRAFSS